MSVLSVLSVALMYCGQTVRQIKMKRGMQVRYASALAAYCVRWGSSSHSPKGHSLQFLAHIGCGQMAAWIKMPICMELGLGPGDFVLDGDPAPQKNFRPMFTIVIVISLEHCRGVRRYWFVQVQSSTLVFYAFYF